LEQSKLFLDITILEKTDRLEGKCFSHDYRGTYHQLSAQVIPDVFPILREVLNATGRRFIELPRDVTGAKFNFGPFETYAGGTNGTF